MTKQYGVVKINWDIEDLADGYYVFQYINGERTLLVRIENPLINSVSIPNIEAKKEHRFEIIYFYYKQGTIITLKAINLFAFINTKGRCVVYHAETPKLICAQKVDTGVVIYWQNSIGASKYRIFKRQAKKSWKTLGETSTASFWDAVCTHESDLYTVRCINEDGKYISSFDSTGICAKDNTKK